MLQHVRHIFDQGRGNRDRNPSFQRALQFEREGDKLVVSNIGNPTQTGTFTMVKERPWDIYKDTSQFIHNGKVEHAFFKGWMGSK